MIVYQVLADLVVALHVGYMAFIIVGQLAILYGTARRRGWVRNPYFRWLHLAAIGAVVVQSWLGMTCPLTDLENYLRQQAGQSRYPGDFVGYWLDQLLFCEFPTWVFVVAYSLFGALVLASFVLAPPRWKPRQAPAS
jgi:hypothetical protein